MSADASYNILQSHAEGHIVLPQPVGDLSLIDSVTGFIQEVNTYILKYLLLVLFPEYWTLKIFFFPSLLYTL
jgi:hypothetical protein